MTAAGIFAPIMDQVARRLLGEPNQALSHNGTLRWGTHGSFKVDLELGVWHDKEAETGGGVIDLVMREQRCDKAGALSWLQNEGLIDPRPREHFQASTRTRSVSTFYDYCDENGVVAYRVERIEMGEIREFRQHGPDGSGGFHSARGCMADVTPLPYRLPELLSADPVALVYVCEGEKDVDRLAGLGLVATTNSGGGGNWRRELSRWLAGRRCVILEDNDEKGARHVAKVKAELDGIAAGLAVLRLPDLPPKGDVSDWLDAGNSIEGLERLAAAALAAPEAQPVGFQLADLNLWAASAPTPKTFLMHRFVPAREITLATGPGGANKSTFGQQLATCCAAGRPLLGVEVQHCAALYLTAEDDEDRLHWMQAHICRAINVRLHDLVGKLHLGTLRGQLGNELCTFDGEGRLRVAPAFRKLQRTITETGCKLLILDNAAHLYPGSENDRAQVTAFLNLLYSLCLEFEVTIILVAHTNKTGDTYSGSTAWLNAVRSQVVLGKPEGSIDPDERVLTIGKANYARPDEQIRFRWHDFALVQDADIPADQRAEIAATVMAASDNEIFLSCLRERTRQGDGRLVGPAPGPNYAPKQFEGMAQAKGLKSDRLRLAMDRLFTIGRIESYTFRNTSKGRDVTIIREASPNPEPSPRTVPEHFPQTTPNPDPEPARAHSLYTTYIPGAASEAAAPGDGGFHRDRPGMILAPGETGDEPLPGWDV